MLSPLSKLLLAPLLLGAAAPAPTPKKAAPVQKAAPTPNAAPKAAPAASPPKSTPAASPAAPAPAAAYRIPGFVTEDEEAVLRSSALSDPERQKVREILVEMRAQRLNAPRRFVWDVPERLDEVEVPGEMKSDGIPVRLAAVRSKLKLDALMRHIYLKYLEAGLYVPKAENQLKSPQVPMLTALDPDTYVSYTAVFQPNPDGTTTVVLGEAHLDERQDPSARGNFAPIFPGAEALIHSEMEGMRSLTFTAKATGDEVKRFYRETFGKAGAREVAPDTFQTGRRQLRVATHAIDGGKQVVSITERLALEDPEALANDVSP